jgi:RNA polymerase sigma-70 factor (ECF subfamily)
MKKPEQKSDCFLVLDFQSGNEEALVFLVKRWHKKLCEKAYWIVKDADLAKDIAQECWDVVMLKINDLNDPNSFGSWISRIVYRKSLDSIKKQRKTQERLEYFKYEQEQDVEVENEESHEYKTNMLLKAIKALPIKQQMVLHLFYLKDYSLKDISNELNISTGTVKSRLFKARESLKQTLKHRTYEN